MRLAATGFSIPVDISFQLPLGFGSKVGGPRFGASNDHFDRAAGTGPHGGLSRTDARESLRYVWGEGRVPSGT